MRPLKIEFQAFGPYKGYEVIDFRDISEKGVFLICGKTGIGKTMILDAMTFALYGKSSGHGRDDFASMRCTNADFEQTTFVKFEFENNGEYYIFERRLERKRINLSAEYNLMQKDSDGNWKTLLENPKEKALNEKAVEIIGLEYDQFRQVIVLPQGQFEKLLTSNSDEKEKILTSIFGEEKWQKIAEQFYKEVEGRKNNLKIIQDGIKRSLQDENCESISQLSLLIEAKEREIEEIDKKYEEEAYDERIKDLQEKLAVSRRFEDLRKAENRVQELEGRRRERGDWEKQLNEAVRANKVKPLFDAVDKEKRTLENRQKENEGAIARERDAKERLDKSKSLFDKHIQNNDVEKKKELKVQYESKMAMYIELEESENILKNLQAEAALSEREEINARQIFDSLTDKLALLQKEYTLLNEEHKELLEKYLAGITGELAESLAEGCPCPVCGSTAHPHKAVKADNSVTKSVVDDKKSDADSKYIYLQEILSKQEAARKESDDKRRKAEEGRTKVIEAKGRLETMKKNLVKGISNKNELESAIDAFNMDIASYEKNREKLEKNKNEAETFYTEAKTKIELSSVEVKKAELSYTKALDDLKEGLLENKFASEEDARNMLLDEKEIEKLRDKIAAYDADMQVTSENLEKLRDELNGISEPNREKCDSLIREATNGKSEYAKNRGILNNDLSRLKKKWDTLMSEGEGIEEKIREAEEDFSFAKKLRGDSGTGLQRYVLGVMFSSVVAAANKMLSMVHGGRYRLYRTDEKGQGNKRGLELKVFDKNSEDHNGRFVNTLSGGEKFLTSLALSIGMSTVAQKSGIKIEALFIDEGFGSLDENSIGDAMNILNSIQEANGLVGIISHVQLLQDRIPTKLRVEADEKGSHIVHTIG